MYINKTLLYGNLTRDPEARALPSGGQVASFSIATNRVYKKADGSKAEQVEYHNIVVFGKTADICVQYLRKGSSLFVEGRLQTRSWESEKGKQYRTEVVAETVQFGPKGSSSSAQGSVDSASYAQDSSSNFGSAPSPRTQKEDVIDYPQDDINPDDIPF